MLRALSQFFAAFYTIFNAIDKLAKSVDHLAGIAEAESEGLAKQMDIERADRIARLAASLTSAK